MLDILHTHTWARCERENSAMLPLTRLQVKSNRASNIASRRSIDVRVGLPPTCIYLKSSQAIDFMCAHLIKNSRKQQMFIFLRSWRYKNSE